jgi:hypothetical protein
MDLQEEGCWVVDLLELTHDRDRWRALVNAVMNLRVLKMRGISSLASNRLASQKVFCSME